MVAPERPPVRQPAIARALGLWLFRARWLMAPFYVGLALALAAVLVVFLKEAWHEFAQLSAMTPEQAILMALSLIDLSLVGNLLLIVIFSGYETFVAPIHMADDQDRLAWMGGIDFSGLKIKLVASVVAISAIALLRVYMRLAEGEAVPDRTLAWMAGLNLIFVLGGLLLALMDLLTSKSSGH